MKNLPEKNKKRDKNSKKKNAKKGAKQKNRLFNKNLFKLAAFAVIIGCGVILFATESDIREKEAELVSLNTQLNACRIENEELGRTLESDDLSAYMERIALEERGYAYPDERRFYDISRN